MLSPTISADAATEITTATSALARSIDNSLIGPWDLLRVERLQWLPELGLGYYHVTASPVEAGYFEHYAALAETDLGKRINAARIAMLKRHCLNGASVVDIGIGAGTFVESLPGSKGYDVNPEGVAWLQERGLFVDPYKGLIDVATLWDCLEHLHDPVRLLDRVRDKVLVALPIFRDAKHALSSKHFKPKEHVWYFTEHGLLWFMRQCGWHCVEFNDAETQLGREDIRSYAFQR